MENEIWKDVVGYEGLYTVSNIGNIKSLDRFIIIKNEQKDYIRFEKGVSKKLSIHYKGYLTSSLSKEGNIFNTFVHRIVARAFIDNPENKKEVNHINGIKTDNRVENLEWVTSKENSKHAWNNNLNKPKNGQQNGNSKLKKEDILVIRNLFLEHSSVQIGKLYNVNNTTINRIVNKKTWRHV